MYSSSNCLLCLEQESTYLVDELTQALTNRGMGVIRSFDLQATRNVQNGCICPHHGADQCSCQLMVLLIYKDNQPPLTLIMEGRDHLTWVSVVYTPGQVVDTRLVSLIVEILRFAGTNRAAKEVAIETGL